MFYARFLQMPSDRFHSQNSSGLSVDTETTATNTESEAWMKSSLMMKKLMLPMNLTANLLDQTITEWTNLPTSLKRTI
jgi:hypothetical protein